MKQETETTRPADVATEASLTDTQTTPRKPSRTFQKTPSFASSSPGSHNILASIPHTTILHPPTLASIGSPTVVSSAHPSSADRAAFSPETRIRNQTDEGASLSQVSARRSPNRTAIISLGKSSGLSSIDNFDYSAVNTGDRSAWGDGTMGSKSYTGSDGTGTRMPWDKDMLERLNHNSLP